MIAVEQGLALFSAQALAMPGITQEELLGSAVVGRPRGMDGDRQPARGVDADVQRSHAKHARRVYDPNMHGVDWAAITEQYRPLVYRISTKSELRDVLQQALGELSVLHVFVSIRNEQPSLPDGEPTACLGGSLAHHDNGLEVVRVYTSGILAAPDSPLGAMAVDIRPGDVITRVDGAQLNLTDAPLSMNLLGRLVCRCFSRLTRTQARAGRRGGAAPGAASGRRRWAVRRRRRRERNGDGPLRHDDGCDDDSVYSRSHASRALARTSHRPSHRRRETTPIGHRACEVEEGDQGRGREW